MVADRCACTTRTDPWLSLAFFLICGLRSLGDHDPPAPHAAAHETLRVADPCRPTSPPNSLRDPDTASSNQVLRTCVHCGFCTATCPTFVLLGDELDSPRGRIYLIKDMLETGRPATEEVVRHVDRCLSCLSCMTTCPSGVNYMHLVDHARTYIEQTYRRPLARAVAARRCWGSLLPRPGLFRLALTGARLARPLGAADPGPVDDGATAARHAVAGAGRAAAAERDRDATASIPPRGSGRPASRC